MVDGHTSRPPGQMDDFTHDDMLDGIHMIPFQEHEIDVKWGTPSAQWPIPTDFISYQDHSHHPFPDLPAIDPVVDHFHYQNRPQNVDYDSCQPTEIFSYYTHPPQFQLPIDHSTHHDSNIIATVPSRPGKIVQVMRKNFTEAGKHTELTRAVFNEQNTFICGVNSGSLNRVCVGEVADSVNIIKMSNKSFSQQIRDIKWGINTAERVLLALDKTVSMFHIEEESVSQIVSHNDSIRELALSPLQPTKLLSGGFDRTLRVSDIESLTNEKSYNTRHVIGSVRWYPYCHDVVSFTSDVGLLSIFDVREGSARVPIVHNCGAAVYSHEYLNSNLILVGYLNGEVDIFDIRERAVVQKYVDHGMPIIGDLAKCPTDGSILLSGSRLSLWNVDQAGMVSKSGDVSLVTESESPNSCTIGSFLYNSKKFAATDSTGNFGIFEYSS